MDKEIQAMVGCEGKSDLNFCLEKLVWKYSTMLVEYSTQVLSKAGKPLHGFSLARRPKNLFLSSD